MTRSEFTQLFALLCEAYNREATSGLSSAYFLVLEELSFEEFKLAVRRILSERKYSTMPMPAELLEAVHGSTEEKAIIALKTLEEAIENHGAYASVCFEDKAIMCAIQALGGWESICRLEADEWKFKRKEFQKIYQAALKNPQSFRAPRYLAGTFERQNSFQGEENQEKIKMIGNFRIAGKMVLEITAEKFDMLAPALLGEVKKESAVDLLSNRLIKRV